jgi:dihydroxyacetone kinase
VYDSAPLGLREVHIMPGDEGWLDLWQAPTHTPLTSWPHGAEAPLLIEPASPDRLPLPNRIPGSRAALDRYTEIVARVHDHLGALDQAVGDGDFGAIDALVPAARRLSAAQDDDEAALTDAALAAITGARSTAEMTGGRGRSSYLSDRVLGTPDPGAIGVALLLTAPADVHEPHVATRLPNRRPTACATSAFTAYRRSYQARMDAL